MMNKKKLDPRAQRTRTLLQNALIELLPSRSMAKIQIKELAEHAGVSRYAFYTHFDGKEDLLLSYCDDVIFAVQQKTFEDAIQAGNFNYEVLNMALFSQWEKHRKVLRWVMEMDNHKLFLNRLRDYVIQICNVPQEIDTKIVYNPAIQPYFIEYVTGGIYMLLRHWVYDGKHLTGEEIGDVAYQLLLASSLAIFSRDAEPLRKLPFIPNES